MIKTLLALATALAALSLTPTSTKAQTYPLIAGYIPVSNVTQHSLIDLDVKAFDEYSDAADWSGAMDVYLNGRYSRKTTGMRKLANFSTDARSVMGGQKWFELYASYWGADAYAHAHVMQSLQGTGEYATAPAIVRTETATKALQYEVVLMYVISELEDAVDDCRVANLSRNDGNAHSWDEGAAFYAGSLEGVGGVPGAGVLQYALAQARCSQFGKCNARGRAVINSRIMALLAQGQSLIRSLDCDLAARVKDDIVRLMTVPLIQGWMRYLWRADPTSGWGTGALAKEKAEGWAFVSAFLPQVHACSASSATTLRAQTHWNSPTYLTLGRNAVLKLVQDQFACMGISCADVGNATEAGVVVLRGCPSVGDQRSGATARATVGSVAMAMMMSVVAVLVGSA